MIQWKVKNYNHLGSFNLLHYFIILIPMHENGDFEDLSICIVLFHNFIILSWP